jgi:1-acyl-sn-glycerol-3-phosphate acyltransferase
MLLHILAALLIVWAIFPRVAPGRRARFLQWWSAKLLRILNITLAVHGIRLDEAARNTIVAANHVSWLDIFVINAAHPARFVAKSEIRDWPVAGWICERAGTIFIRRTKRSDTARITKVMHDILAGGDTIGLFPEGTTTAGDRLLKFNSSLFEPAIVNSAALAPAAIRYRTAIGQHCRAAAFIGELSITESLGLIIGQRSLIAEITFAPRIAAAGLTRRDLALRAEAAVAAILDVPLPHPDHRFSSVAAASLANAVSSH